MERVARIELANKPWQGFRLPLHHTRFETLLNVERDGGIEPPTEDWKSAVLPLN